ncbi:hypothetical protein A3Q34_19230 [Colwellia sp. PAMC 20917]|uniref:hypothetical protein n=1 Tax=Colwellia sp. PAMC 20917 TaxID=1816218 RepID=UPI00087806EA|nr:hypothetical protein [Colwellia sp. PAMC 20917]AOW78785.1 hypothetical protein A3Q34_19230 [Colwellia sp. PAMC 20917]
MRILLTAQVLTLLSSASALANAKNTSIDITGISLTKLFNLKITSLSKKKQTLHKVAAAVYVLTLNEIDSLGATTIADALGYVSGVEVAY